MNDVLHLAEINRYNETFFIGRTWHPAYPEGKAQPMKFNPGRYDVHPHGLFESQAEAQAKCDELNV